MISQKGPKFWIKPSFIQGISMGLLLCLMVMVGSSQAQSPLDTTTLGPIPGTGVLGANDTSLVDTLNGPDLTGIYTRFQLKLLPIKYAVNFLNQTHSIKGVGMSRCGYPNSNYLFLASSNLDSDISEKTGILLKVDLGSIGASQVLKAAVRLALANPANGVEGDMDFYVYETSNEWDPNSFKTICLSNYCYSSIETFVDWSSASHHATGTIEEADELGDRQVLSVDITDLVNQWLGEGREEASIFLMLHEPVSDDGPFDSFVFFGQSSKYDTLRPKLQVLLSGSGGGPECGDGVCSSNETCTSDCDYPADIVPPTVLLATSKDEGHATSNLEVIPALPAGLVQLYEPGEALTLTAEVFECDTGSNTQQYVEPNFTNNLVEIPSYLGGNESMLKTAYDLDALLGVGGGTPKRIMIWEAGRTSPPKDFQLCASDSCSCSVTVHPDIGPHLYCTRAIDEYGNMSDVQCREVYVGTGFRPTIRYQIINKNMTLPSGIYPGEEFYLRVQVAQILGTSDFGLKAIEVSIRSSDNEQVLYYPYVLDNSPREWENTFEFTVPTRLLPRPADPKYLYITIMARNTEGLRTVAKGRLSVKRPIQMEYGLPFPNSGNDEMCWDEYLMTFGDEIYARVSICPFPPFVLPNTCLDDFGCECHVGRPGSGLQEVVKALGGWVQKLILEILGLDSYIESFFCVDSLDDIGVPTVKSLFYYPFYRYLAAAQGRCTGFTTATAAMYRSGSYSPLYGGDKDISQWDESVDTTVRRFLDAHQGTVISNEFISRLIHNFFLSTNEVLEQVAEELRSDRHGGISILGWPVKDDFSCRPTGHTLFVDHLEYMGDNTVRLYVYDSNRNYQDYTLPQNLSLFSKYPYITFYNDQDNFEFLMPGGDVWSRGDSFGTCYVELADDWNVQVYTERLGGIALYLPTDLLLRDDYSLPKIGELLNADGINFLMLFIGNSDAEISDGAGHILSTSNQQGKTAIPSSFIFAMPGGGENERGFHVALLPADQAYSVSFKGGTGEGGQLFAIFGPNINGAVNMFMTKGSNGAFSISSGNNSAVDLAITKGTMIGSVNVLFQSEERLEDIATKYADQGIDQGENVPDSLGETSVTYSRLVGLKGVFSGGDVGFSILGTGDVKINTLDRRPLGLYLITDESQPASGVVQGLEDAINVEDKSLLLAPGTHTIKYVPQPGVGGEQWEISGQFSYNAAPPVLKGSCTLASGCADQATRVKLSDEAKRTLSIVPGLEVPKEMVGKVGNAYCLIYWKEQDTFFMVTQDGIVLFEGSLIPYASATELGESISFKILEQGMDLSGLKGTFDIFMGVATRDDLEDLVYNWYEMEF